MRQAILDFAHQFEYEPVLEYADRLNVHHAFVVAGMGGSGLAADILKAYAPDLDLIVHKNYGLPDIDLNGHLIILNSYSGNTEETIDALNEAQGRDLEVLVISTGGKMIEWAVSAGVPHIQMPDTGLQPRSAVGFNIRALTRGMEFASAYQDLSGLALSLRPEDHEEEGKRIAQTLKGHVPVIYASTANQAVAYNWKIKMNETGKIPAFCHVFPELNHNEMTGFDVKPGSQPLTSPFMFIMIRDDEDHPRIQRRMDVTAELYKNRGLPVMEVILTGRGRFQRMFTCLTVADWAALHTAEQYGLEAEAVPMVEDFKKML